MKVKSEGLEDRLWLLFNFVEDAHADDFTILSDSFILFFKTTKEELAEFTLNIRDKRLELMRGALLGRKFEADIEKVESYRNMLLHSYEQYPFSIYLKAYYMVGYIVTGDVNHLSAAMFSPYHIPATIPEDKDSYMYY